MGRNPFSVVAAGSMTYNLGEEGGSLEREVPMLDRIISGPPRRVTVKLLAIVVVALCLAGCTTTKGQVQPRVYMDSTNHESRGGVNFQIPINK